MHVIKAQLVCGASAHHYKNDEQREEPRGSYHLAQRNLRDSSHHEWHHGKNTASHTAEMQKALLLP